MKRTLGWPLRASSSFIPDVRPLWQKSVPFDAGFVGKLNLYLSAVDDLLKHPEDKPAIGLLLCRSKDRIVVKYALRDLKKPIGVAQWETKIVTSLPKELKGSLPSIEAWERSWGIWDEGQG